MLSKNRAVPIAVCARVVASITTAFRGGSSRHWKPILDRCVGLHSFGRQKFCDLVGGKLQQRVQGVCLRGFGTSSQGGRMEFSGWTRAAA